MNTETSAFNGTVAARRILAQDDLECSILTVAPGGQTPCLAAHWTQEHVLFVIEGAAVVQVGDVGVHIRHDDALYIAAGRDATITADSAWLKLLRVDFTRRTIVEPPIFAAPGVHASDR
jgi:glyoxylate utilization-related uncharacterized protein